MDVNPYQTRSLGGGFRCIRIVPRTDDILIANDNGTFVSARKVRKHSSGQNFMAKFQTEAKHYT